MIFTDKTLIMNKTFSISFAMILLLSHVTFSQKAKESTAPTSTPSSSLADPFVVKEKVFREALKYGDLLVAKQCLYEMIVLKPTEKNLRDSLAFIYINLGAAKEAILLSREILSSNPDNTNILEVKAIAEQSLGMSKEALADYETLYAKSTNIFHLYQIATLQYELKRIAECNASVDKLLANPDAEKKDINIGTGTRGQQQNVLLKSAALNVKGVLAMDLNELSVAKSCFETALKLSPDFVLAKNNMDFINKKTSPASDKTGKPQVKNPAAKK